MTSSLPASIPDTQLGLSTSEIHLLRQHQSLALGGAPSSYHYAQSTASSRGRGQSRSSASSSRAGSSNATAPGNGRLVLEAGSLAVLGSHFERLMARIEERVDYLTSQTQASTLSQSRSAAHTIAGADAEIARFRDLLRQIDELETEFDKVRHIRDIVKGFRRRVEGVGSRVGRR